MCIRDSPSTVKIDADNTYINVTSGNKVPTAGEYNNIGIVVRQGNYLACSYVAELTPQPYIYNYWLEMVAALKNSRKN